MTDRATWLALAERCRTLSGVDDERQVGIEILKALGWAYRDSAWHDANRAWVSPFFAPATSLDAITALVEREFGQLHAYRPVSQVAGLSDITLYRGMIWTPEVYADAATPAIALCAAFCTAKAETAG